MRNKMENEALRKKIIKYAIGVLSTVVALALGLCIGFFFLPPKEPAPQKTEESAPATTAEKEELLSSTAEQMETTPGRFSKTPLMKGIDVSKWQGKPDWKKIADGGVDFAMIRIGYHGSSGSLGEDESAEYNLEKADENGILTGVYFYSLAESAAEAKAEAEWVLDRVGKYAISLPIVIDYEMAENDTALAAAARTDIALSFLETVKNAGYDGMLYAPTVEFEDPALWEKERILAEFMVWGAEYEKPTYPESDHPNREIDYAMWQYSNTGRVDGISGNVDLNLAYFTCERKEPKNPPVSDPSTQQPTTPVKEFNQTFTPANRRVTAKIEVNLRKIPSIDGELVGTLKNGDYLLCTGDSDMGWSRLEYNGQRVFAVTTYLLNEDGGSTIPTEKFQTVSQLVTAKDVVNLRRAPSTDAEIAGTLQNGTYLTRTGIGDKGWSRLDYNGETVYAVTSYLQQQ